MDNGVAMCVKKMIFSSRLRHFNSKTHIPKQKCGIVVVEYEIIKSEIDEIDFIFDNFIKDCRDKFFHTFEYRCVYDIKFTSFKILKKFFYWLLMAKGFSNLNYMD